MHIFKPKNEGFHTTSLRVGEIYSKHTIWPIDLNSRGTGIYRLDMLKRGVENNKKPEGKMVKYRWRKATT